MSERQDAGVADYVDEMLHDDDDHFNSSTEYGDDYDGSEYYDNLTAQEESEEDEESEIDEENEDQENALGQPNAQGGGVKKDVLGLEGKSPLEQLVVLLKLAKKSKNEAVKSTVKSLNMGIRSATVAYVGWNIGLVYMDYWTDTAAAVLNFVRLSGTGFVLNPMLSKPPVKTIIGTLRMALEKEHRAKLAKQLQSARLAKR